MSISSNIVIIGSGVAGMSLAIRLAENSRKIPEISEKKIILMTQSELVSGSTPLAQGGIAAVVQKSDNPRSFNDSFESHFEDTMKAGHYQNNPEAVKILVESAPLVMGDLQRWGIHFHQDRHLEGGHSHHRIFNTGDSTGKTIAQGLAKKVREYEKLGRIEVLEDCELVDFFTPPQSPSKRGTFYPPLRGELGGSCSQILLTLLNKKTKTTSHISAEKLFLATGGYASRFDTFTTVPEATGSAIEIFEKNGGKTKNMDWVQFHPTVLDIACIPRFLISEAVRGAGAIIVNEKGEKICNPLLPRDVIVEKIKTFQALARKKNINSQAFLDARTIQNFPEKFPVIFTRLTRDFFLNPLSEFIPITPAAHYCMGGIETDLYGKTNLKNIFALGECACTGVHGKNRLASNSLLEGLVFSRQIVESFCKTG